MIARRLSNNDRLRPFFNLLEEANRGRKCLVSSQHEQLASLVNARKPDQANAGESGSGTEATDDSLARFVADAVLCRNEPSRQVLDELGIRNVGGTDTAYLTGLQRLENSGVLPKPGQGTGGQAEAIATSVPGLHISSLLPEIATRIRARATESCDLADAHQTSHSRDRPRDGIIARHRAWPRRRAAPHFRLPVRIAGWRIA